jgi:type I restriction enzyme S subunit
MSWRVRKLGEFITVKHGWAFKGEYFSGSGKYILLTPGNAHEHGGLKLRLGKEKFYLGEFPPEYLMKTGDMLVIMTDLIQAAPILGGALVVPEDDRFLHNQRLGLVEYLQDSPIDKGFLYYLLNSSPYRAQVKGSATGATVRHTAPKRICDCSVLVPDTLEEQQQVAQFLSAYDDLIGINQCRIALLEESARLLYREWFINLRFPGSEPKNSGQELPEGWVRKNLYDIADLTMGFPFQAALFNSDGDGKKAIRIRDIPNLESSTWTTENPSSVRYEVVRGDFLLGMDGIFHMNHWAGDAGWLVQRVCRVRAKDDLYQAYIAHALYEPIKNLEASISGATVAHLGAKHLKAIELLIPPQDFFGELTLLNDLLEQKITLIEQNKVLQETRNTLLPKLMSGAIQV